MLSIKSLTIEGFKSFGKRTELVFEKGLNVIVGANGSGKSNIIDAINFAFGKLGTKSLRTDSHSDLLFHGSKTVPKANRAHIKVVFDNSSKILVVDGERPDEVVIERILKQDGSSIYKINGKTKTRNEILELLGQINMHYPFNIVQQQEIFKFVDMKDTERRELIEYLAGIGAYEMRKEKAVRELEKCEEKMKEVRIVLNEKLHFLENLKSEKRKAELYNKLKEAETRIKYSILFRKKQQKVEEKNALFAKLEQNRQRKKEKEETRQRLQQQIAEHRKEIEEIDRHIQTISGVEQKELQQSLVNLKTQLARLEAKKNFLANQIKAAEEKIKHLDIEIAEAEKESLQEQEQGQETDKNVKAIEEKISEAKKRLDYLSKRLAEITEKETSLLIAKDRIGIYNKEFLALSEEISTKSNEVARLNIQLEKIKAEAKDIKQIEQEVSSIKKAIAQNLELIQEREATIKALEREKEAALKEIEEIKKLTICPKCKRPLEEEHRKKLESEIKARLDDASLKISGFLQELEALKKDNNELKTKLEKLEQELSIALKQKYAKEQLSDSIGILKQEISKLTKKKKELEEKIAKLEREIPELEADVNAKSAIEDEIAELKQKLNTLRLEKEATKDKAKVKTLLDFKERELESLRAVRERTEKEKIKAEKELNNLNEEIAELNKLIEEKEKKDEEIKKKFSDMIEKKNKLHEKIAKAESQISAIASDIFWLDNAINELNVNVARIEAEMKALDDEMADYSAEIQPIKLPVEKLEEKLHGIKLKLAEIGNVNMLAIEAYEKTRAEVEQIEEKLKVIEAEKQEIVKQIEKIDREKKKIFMSTFDKINEEFGNNFSLLSEKGVAKLVLENEENPFEGGVDIVIQVGKGKHFSTTALSGGEKVLVALAFIFAIQKLVPYPFYIFDEIDAALDKHNSERLAELIKGHIAKHQCIIVTHNDATLKKADLVYGVSMQDGVSKVISLKLD
jgi:chromosome segregation protein